VSIVNYILNEYKPFDDLESVDLEKFRNFISEYKNKIYDRNPNQPVITASAIIVNPEFTKILVMHHKLHNFYKQFGGHADGESDLLKVAKKELNEEAGIDGKLIKNEPFDLIRWNFPERTKNNIFYPAHDCFDIAFLFMLDEKIKLSINTKEVLDTKWITLNEWRDYNDLQNSVYNENPQNLNYQQRIYKKINLFADNYKKSHSDSVTS